MRSIARKLILVLGTLVLWSLPAFAAGGTCPSAANYVNPANPTGSLVTLSSLGITSCFYISKSSGADTNAGTTEGAPWAHAPGMPSCANTCSSTTPTAGEGFIFKGGDTWASTDLDLYWQWQGTSSHPFYLGVDLGWPSSGWTRPIFTCGGAQCTYQSNGDGFWTDQGSPYYALVDNIEWTGLLQCDSPTYHPNFFSIYGSDETFTRNYIHGWSHCATFSNDTSAVFSPNSCCGGGLNDNFYFNIIDFSDSSGYGMTAYGQGGSGNIIAYGIINHISNGIEGSVAIVHDLNISDLAPCTASSGCHQNAIQAAGPNSGVSTVLIYNTIITNVSAGGITKMWPAQSSGNSGITCTFSTIFNGTMRQETIGISASKAQRAVQFIFLTTRRSAVDQRVLGQPVAGLREMPTLLTIIASSVLSVLVRTALAAA